MTLHIQVRSGNYQHHGVPAVLFASYEKRRLTDGVRAKEVIIPLDEGADRRAADLAAGAAAVARTLDRVVVVPGWDQWWSYRDALRELHAILLRNGAEVTPAEPGR